MNSLLLSDGYKYFHPEQYPDGTTLVYSNFTPRSNKYAPKGCEEVVVFGPQGAMIKLHEDFQINFFDKPRKEVIEEIGRELSMYSGITYDTSRFEALHKLGYLPIKVKTLEEGTLCPIKVPMMTIVNTEPEFYWITNFLESILSNLLWKPVTSASIAYAYKKTLLKHANTTDEKNVAFVDWQGHDFSFRGLDSVDAVIFSGMGHLTSFSGTDSLPAIWGARKYYNEKGFVAGSVPATEHSVMCAGSKEGELETFSRLLDIYKESPVLSVVSDTWDLWNVLTNILPKLKDKILAGKTKLVIRPDSGDPVDIICGLDIRFAQENKQSLKSFNEESLRFRKSKDLTPEVLPSHKGVIELLWDVFGGTINEQGFKVLDSHIGAIYGDSITIDRADQICERLKAKGFASTNIVLGIGSFTYQMNTRDTFGFAMKATYVEKIEVIPCIDAKCPGATEEITKGYAIFKDPITDDGTKKSATGLLQVYKEDGVLKLKDNCTWEEEAKGELKLLYQNGIFYSNVSLTQIREKLWH